ncbi:hypothetical protein MPSEU_000105600 [Mayamaea pseudoterrestris]|nr:hypothetical protein MPSEU_000105600 [Mayamaea pseudoterrestris]
MKQAIVLLILCSVKAASAFSVGRSRCASTSRHARHQIIRTPSLLFVTRDEYLQPHFEAPPRALAMDRIVDCAESNGLCSMNEMIDMIEELDRLNESSESHSDETLQFDSTMTARQALKLSLQSQMDCLNAKEELKAQQHVLRQWKLTTDESELMQRETLDHSYNHHVDYQAIAEYESH